MPDSQDEPFLSRWSRRKRGDDVPERVRRLDEPLAEHTPAPTNVSLGDEQAPGAAAAPAEQPVPEDLAGVDVTTLDYSSDFERFMRDDVPDALRRQALRQLWRSDPVLANLDGLCDYDDDFTDAALAVKVLETAHKVGRGFLDDDDLVDTEELAKDTAPESAPDDADSASASTEARDEPLDQTGATVASDTSDEAAAADDTSSLADAGSAEASETRAPISAPDRDPGHRT